MLTLPDSDLAALLNAVPSFEAPWSRESTDRAEYERQWPDDVQTPGERTGDFLSRLASHLGARVAHGDLHEAEWLMAVLEHIYQHLDDRDAVELTVGFLESLN